MSQVLLIGVPIGCFVVFMYLLVFALCKVAGEADEDIQR